MKKYIALFLALAMSLSLFAGCSKADTDTTTASSQGTTGGTTQGTTAGAKSNEIVTATNTAFATLDPSLMSTTAMSNVYFNMGASFFRSDADGNYNYELGDSYTVSEDGLLYTFKIKKGVLWSDGVELKAEHFEYGIKRTIGYGPMNAYAVRNLTAFVVGAKEAADAQAD